MDGTRMSPDSAYDQFVCRIWLTRTPLWVFLGASSYGILVIALERYIAVIYPIFYNVRMNEHILYFSAGNTDTKMRFTHATAHVPQNWTQFQMVIDF